MTNAKAAGIIFPNMHDESIPEIISRRTMASVPFAGRYRMIDFCLSAMSNAGMQNIGVVTHKNYQSLMDHLGSGREWDLARKIGGLAMFPPYAQNVATVRHSRIETLHSVRSYLEFCKEDLVIMSDCNIACNINFSKLITQHVSSGADITLLYEKATITKEMQEDNTTLSIGEDGMVNSLRTNDYLEGIQNLSMNTYVVGREYLLELVRNAMASKQFAFETDFMLHGAEDGNARIFASEFTGYRARIYSLQSFFEENMRLLKPENLAALFPESRPIYTKVRDEAPVRYAYGSKVKNCIIADGCTISGEVENCVLFRGVKVGKGAKLKNCIIMQGGIIGSNTVLEYIITDKNVTIDGEQTLRGASSFPMFMAKGSHVTK